MEKTTNKKIKEATTDIHVWKTETIKRKSTPSELLKLKDPIRIYTMPIYIILYFTVVFISIIKY